MTNLPLVKCCWIKRTFEVHSAAWISILRFLGNMGNTYHLPPHLPSQHTPNQEGSASRPSVSCRVCEAQPGHTTPHHVHPHHDVRRDRHPPRHQSTRVLEQRHVSPAHTTPLEMKQVATQPWRTPCWRRAWAASKRGSDKRGIDIRDASLRASKAAATSGQQSGRFFPFSFLPTATRKTVATAAEGETCVLSCPGVRHGQK